MPAPGWLDTFDVDRAQSMRAELGRLGWIVSWHPAGREWLARVSVKRVARTVERTGPTRAEAIGRAVATLGVILELRAKRCSIPKRSSTKRRPS